MSQLASASQIWWTSTFILALAFTSCNMSRSYGSHASNSALLLQSTKYAKLVNCVFHDNIGTALAVDNTNITLEENEFTHVLMAIQQELVVQST